MTRMIRVDSTSVEQLFLLRLALFLLSVLLTQFLSVECLSERPACVLRGRLLFCRNQSALIFGT